MLIFKLCFLFSFDLAGELKILHTTNKAFQNTVNDQPESVSPL